LPALLAVRPMVYLGHISFGLYMVHELVHTSWNWAAEQFEIRLVPGLVAQLTVLGLIVAAGAGAALMYHGVEEPARRWMRRMVSTRPPRSAERVEPVHRLAAVPDRANRAVPEHKAAVMAR